MKNLVRKPTGVFHARVRINSKDKITCKSLKTKDKLVAQKRIDELYTRMEREAAGLVTPKKLKQAAEGFLIDLVKTYVRTLEAGTRHIIATENRLKKLCKECEWKRIRDVDSVSFLEWRASQGKYTPKTKNHYLSSLNSFFTWLVENGLAVENPVGNVKPVKKKGRHSFKYRALTDAELSMLLKLDRRSHIYLFAVLTGYRHSEVGAVTWADIHKAEDFSYVLLPAEKTKNKKEQPIKLHPDLVQLLENMRSEGVKPEEYVFPRMPDNRTVRRDFLKAGIVTTNSRREKASFHSLRKTFCTMLHNAGVPQRVAQEAMRHSSSELTNDIYADRNLLSVASAIDSLPSLLGGTKTGTKTGTKEAQNGHKNGSEEMISDSGREIRVYDKHAETLGKTGKKEAENSVVEALRVLQEWCTRMESNHHAIAGTRT